ncbi:helix-turn-helix domain-containing protein [Nocardia colli]|uniref:helix-turn-helix domain-containing protein n=1 Tax=Nocardia colli TaxID=2545717 RepID=UPI001CC6C501|nr:helix-turn-helix domain-containing protein [Nocardia colli]
MWLWPGHAVYRGPSLRLDAHCGSVLCLAVGLDAPFTVRADGIEQTVRSALIPPRMVHRVVATGERMLFCYIDPGSPRAKSSWDRMTTRSGGFGSAHRNEQELISLAAQPEFDPVAAVDLACGPGVATVDDRIAAAAATLLTHPARPNSAAELAAEAHLSTSRFLHLFARDAGTSFRRYRMWARMLSVGRAVAKVADLTTAAADAGFASPSHFSDTFHAMCGLTPSRLLVDGARIVVLDS